MNDITGQPKNWMLAEQMRQSGENRSITNDPVLTGEFVITPLMGWEITANYTHNEKNSRYDNTYLTFA
jgi:hypothetical protein